MDNAIQHVDNANALTTWGRSILAGAFSASLAPKRSRAGNQECEEDHSAVRHAVLKTLGFASDCLFWTFERLVRR
jgi:hypothetical protein